MLVRVDWDDGYSNLAKVLHDLPAANASRDWREIAGARRLDGDLAPC